MNQRELPTISVGGRTLGVPKLTPKLIWVLFVALVLLMIASQFLVYIRPNEFAIKEVKLGNDRGIHEQVYGPGWVVAIPGVSRFHRMPSDIQVLDLSHRAEEQRWAGHRGEKSAHIQTSDGFFVDVDVSILYRISDPYKVVTSIGPGELFIDNGIIPRAEPFLKQSLGTLTTEEFYNSHLRTARAMEAREQLDKDVKPKGLHVEQVLVRYFEYSPEIQRNIEEKKLKDQQVFKNQSEKRAASQEAILKRVTQEGEARVSIKLQEGEAYITTRRADQELYSRKKHAEADLQVKLAEAFHTDLKNNALQGVGSDKMVGLKMAEVLGGVKVIVLPSDGTGGFNPMDLDKTMKFFGVEKK